MDSSNNQLPQLTSEDKELIKLMFILKTLMTKIS